MNCVTSSNLSLIWNREKLDSFAPTRGLCQGDPLSLYLFVLCMKKLALLIMKKVQSRLWMLVTVSRNGPGISHLFFADDCLLFVKAKSSQVCLLHQVVESTSVDPKLKNFQEL